MVIKRTTNSRFLLKILSVLISLLLWVYVSNSEHISIDKNIELEVLYPSNVSLTNEIPKEIVYSLKGPRAIVRLILDREEKITIDLRGQKVDSHHRHFFNFKSSDIDLPIGVQVLKILPSNIELSFDEKMRKSLPINLQTVGSLPAHYKMISSRLSPTHLEVYGPKKEITNIKEVMVGPLDMSAMRGTGRRSLPVVGLSERIGLASDTLPEFIYEIKPLKANYLLRDIAIQKVGNKKVLKMNVSKVLLMIYVDPDEEKLTKKDVKVYFDIPPTAGEHLVPLKVKLSDRADLFKVEPEAIKVTVE